jgi:hypothetical protein
MKLRHNMDFRMPFAAGRKRIWSKSELGGTGCHVTRDRQRSGGRAIVRCDDGIAAGRRRWVAPPEEYPQQKRKKKWIYTHPIRPTWGKKKLKKTRCSHRLH